MDDVVDAFELESSGGGCLHRIGWHDVVHDVDLHHHGCGDLEEPGELVGSTRSEEAQDVSLFLLPQLGDELPLNSHRGLAGDSVEVVLGGVGAH